MCPPEHFTVDYAINPWMDPTVPVDAALALKQWQLLHDTLTDLGHAVHVLDPRPGLPDMVYAANGAFSVDGAVYGARFKHPQRSAEAIAHVVGDDELNPNFIIPSVFNADVPKAVAAAIRGAHT